MMFILQEFCNKTHKYFKSFVTKLMRPPKYKKLDKGTVVRIPYAEKILELMSVLDELYFLDNEADPVEMLNITIERTRKLIKRKVL